MRESTAGNWFLICIYTCWEENDWDPKWFNKKGGIIMVEVKRKPNESTGALLRRFSRFVQQSGVLLKAKSDKFHQKKPTEKKEKKTRTLMLKEKLQNDMKEAMKAGDALRRMALSLVLSAVKNKEIEKRSKLTDEEIIDAISSEVKKRKESIESYEKGGREELAQKERDELNVLMEYMPEQMSEDEIRTEAKKAIAETGAKEIKEMGKVLGVLMPNLKGRADGQTVSRIVKEELQK